MDDNLLKQIEDLHNKKNAGNDPLGKIAKLGEEAAELAASIQKLVIVEQGLYPSRYDRERAFNHVIEEVADVYALMKVAGLTPETADPNTRQALLDQLLFKACRFIERMDLYKKWKKDEPPVVSKVVHRRGKHLRRIKRKNQPVKVSGLRTGEIVLSMMPTYDVFNNPWAQGLEGDF